MSETINKPKTTLRRSNSVTLNWEDTFQSKPDQIYILQILNDLRDWATIYWGKKTEFIVTGLRACDYYLFRLRTLDEDNWVEFKSATEAEQFYVRHLTRAVILGKIALIRKIISNRPSLLEIDNDFIKPQLMQAVENGDLATVNTLVNYGASVNQISTSNRRTSLMMAVHGGHIEIAKFLLQKGATGNVKDVNDMTLLHFAVDSNCCETVRFVLGLDVDINSADNMGWTSLLRAVAMEVSDDIIKLLLSSGSDPNISDKNGFDFKKHCEISNRRHLIKNMLQLYND